MSKIIRRIKLNIKRKKSKNILKCLIFIILFTMLFSSLYIQNISKQLEDSIIDEYDIYVDIESNIHDWDYNDFEQYIKDTIRYNNMITDIANNTTHSFYDFNIRAIPYYGVFHSLKIENEEITLYYTGGNYYDEYDNSWETLMNHSLISNSIKSVRSTIPLDMEMNAITLIEGRTFTEEEIENGENVCLIPVGLKKYNSERGESIWLDDEIIISEILVNEKGEIIHYKEHSFKVIGVFSPSKGSNLKNIIIPEKQLNNIMTSSIETARQYDEDYMSNNIFNLYELSPTFFKFTTIKDFEEFLIYLENYTDEINNKYTYTTTMESQFTSISNILSISKSISYISLLCLIACISITFILLLFEVESNKKEIGILMAMGESLKEIIIQYVLEILIISLLSVSITFIFTQTIGGTAIRSIIKNEIAKEENVTFQQSPVEKYEIELEQYTEILQPLSLKENLSITLIYIIGISIFESIVLVILISRIDPKELLKDD